MAMYLVSMAGDLQSWQTRLQRSALQRFLFTYSFGSTYLLRAHQVPGTVLGIGVQGGAQSNIFPDLMEFIP